MNNKAKLEIQKFGWEHVQNYRVDANKRKCIRFSSHRAFSKITKIHKAPDNIFKILSVWFLKVFYSPGSKCKALQLGVHLILLYFIWISLLYPETWYVCVFGECLSAVAEITMVLPVSYCCAHRFGTKVE